MRFFKNKYLLPITLAGLLSGYAIADKVIPHYFHPTTETQFRTMDILTAIGAQPNYYRQTPSGNYLAGQFAQRQKNWEKAYDYMDRVLDAEPNNLILNKHTMVLAMAAGDIKHATEMAAVILEQEDNNLLATLFLALNDFDKENYQAAIDILNTLEAQNAAAFLVPILTLWAESGLEKANINILPSSSFYAYHALLIHHYIKPDKALLNYALASYKIDEVDLRDVTQFADLLIQTGEKDKALTLYKLIEARGFANDKIKNKITALEENTPLEEGLLSLPKITTAKEGAALVFFDMANILLRENSEDSAAIFAQMALHLNPSLDTSHMIIANILVRNNQTEAAIEAFQNIKPTSDNYILAQRQIADLYNADENDKAAIKILTNLYKDQGDLDSLIQVGDVYRYQENYDEAVKIYSDVLNKWDKIPEKYWHVLYARGMAYERLKDFKKSEDDLVKALEFRPNHPYVLNYLGYSWADQNINLDQSLDMLMRATQSKPEDGYIADSLGWVFYKMNNFEEAIPHLERAVELLPYDGTLNDHLGDAYWQVGRKNEAKFQWQRAMNYSEDKEQELKDSLQEKLGKGIDTIKAAPKNTLSEAYIKDNGV
jgi:tetratricopeptide (TPR) repeat protein